LGAVPQRDGELPAAPHDDRHVDTAFAVQYDRPRSQYWHDDASTQSRADAA
jgi:hypothetical protein